LALGAILLQRDAYRKISKDDWLTGPALLLGILGTIIFSSTLLGKLNLGMLVFHIVFWFITVLIMYLAGRLLRGKGTFTSVVRTVGFAQAVFLLDIFSIIPSLTPLVDFIIALVNFIAMWIGVASAHELKGWKTVILPVVYILVAVVGLVIIISVFGGLKLTIGSITIGF
jgi:hypothetical protein